MLFSFLRRTPRRARESRRQAWSLESLEPRQLLAVDQLMAAEVTLLLNRASVATSTEDAIIAVVDRGGHILGVRVEQDVLDAYGSIETADGVINTAKEQDTLTFAIDGAVAKARTAAFFANGTADSRIDPETGLAPAGTATPTVGPLTSRTVRFISQSTITQREVESNPNIADPDSTLRGPGYVAPIGIGGHFPPAIAHTPQVDLFGIEHTNRDSIVHPGFDSIKGTADDIDFRTFMPGDPRERFNIPLSFVPAGQGIDPPESYGFVTGLTPNAQSRGIATLPGGIPLYRGFDLVGGVGVFFPGTTGDPDLLGTAAFEQNFIPGIRQSEAQRTNAPKVLEAEYIAFAAAGGGAFGGLKARDKIGAITDADANVVDAVPFLLPFGRIDLVGITLQIIGPTPGVSGVRKVEAVGKKLGVGHNSGADQQVTSDPLVKAIDGIAVPEGWLVTPHDSPSGSLTAAQVEEIIQQGIDAAEATRAAIRLKVTNPVKGTTVPGARTRMVLAVADEEGNVLGLYRMHDSTIFSIDVAVAKARNVMYYADPTQIEDVDRVDDNHDGVPDANVPAGTAFTNRTFRFLAEPRYPQGVDGSKPGAFSILTDPGFKTDLLKSKRPTVAAGAVENAAGPLPASAFVSVLGFDSFNPGRNFRQTTHIENQNGIVFFPGSAPLYNSGVLVGGYGISGDGVDQDDVVTYFGVEGFRAPDGLTANHFRVRNARLPYTKFNRNPFA